MSTSLGCGVRRLVEQSVGNLRVLGREPLHLRPQALDEHVGIAGPADLATQPPQLVSNERRPMTIE